MNNKLFVGNFVFSTTEDDLRNLFSEFGQVEDVVLINDRETGRSRGFGFVTMSTPEEAQAAVEGMDGREVEGRNLAVNEARPQEPRPKRNFEGGGGGGGFRGGGGGGGGFKRGGGGGFKGGKGSRKGGGRKGGWDEGGGGDHWR